MGDGEDDVERAPLVDERPGDIEHRQIRLLIAIVGTGLGITFFVVAWVTANQSPSLDKCDQESLAALFWTLSAITLTSVAIWGFYRHSKRGDDSVGLVVLSTLGVAISLCALLLAGTTLTGTSCAD